MEQVVHYLAAVTTFLSCGKTVKKSCELGIKYVNSAIKSNPNMEKVMAQLTISLP
jgi:hydroxymethylpyrimidine/phosphomethylpyrimidine kinase